MELVQFLILAALGLLGGTLSGLVNGGGGIIFVPAGARLRRWLGNQGGRGGQLGGCGLRFPLWYAS